MLRLVSTEIALHKALSLEDHLPRHPDEYINGLELKRDPGRRLRTDAWEQVRTTLAPLLPADRFAALTKYYSNVQWFNELLDEHSSQEETRMFIPSLARSLWEDGPKMREWMREEYIGPMTTGY